MRPAMLCLMIIASIGCATPEERAAKQIAEAENQLVEAVEDLIDIEAPPASREALRDARRELDDLAALWDEVLVHVAAADEAIEREGYSHWGWNLEEAKQWREAQLARHEKNLEHETESAVTFARQMIANDLAAARRRIASSKEIVGRKARTEADAQRRLRELENLTDQ